LAAPPAAFHPPQVQPISPLEGNIHITGTFGMVARIREWAKAQPINRAATFQKMSH